MHDQLKSEVGMNKREEKFEENQKKRLHQGNIRNYFLYSLGFTVNRLFLKFILPPLLITQAQSKTQKRRNRTNVAVLRRSSPPSLQATQ